MLDEVTQLIDLFPNGYAMYAICVIKIEYSIRIMNYINESKHNI